MRDNVVVKGDLIGMKIDSTLTKVLFGIFLLASIVGTSTFSTVGIGSAYAQPGGLIPREDFEGGDGEEEPLDPLIPRAVPQQPPSTGSPGPNGQIAFTSNRDLNWEVYVMNADGSGEPIQLTDTGGEIQELTWSPDGTRIAFIDQAIDGCYIGVIDVVNADGPRVPTSLTDNPIFGEIECSNPDWSPDGTKIAFTMSDDISIMNADGTGVPTILTDNPSFHREIGDFNDNDSLDDPSWSPDSTRIAFVKEDFDLDTEEIFVMDAADGSNPIRLSAEGAQDSEPDWSPDGTKIAFSSGDGIYVGNADGTGVPIRQTPFSGAIDDHPSWSPDSTMIAFESDRDNDIDDIYVVVADGRGMIARLGDEGDVDGLNEYPEWSPSPVAPPPQTQPGTTTPSPQAPTTILPTCPPGYVFNPSEGSCELTTGGNGPTTGGNLTGSDISP